MTRVPIANEAPETFYRFNVVKVSETYVRHRTVTLIGAFAARTVYWAIRNVTKDDLARINNTNTAFNFRI